MHPCPNSKSAEEIAVKVKERLSKQTSDIWNTVGGIR